MQLSDLQLFLGLQIPEDYPSPLNPPAASAPLRRKAPVHIREWLSDLVVCYLSEYLLHRPPRLVLHPLKQHHHALHGIHALQGDREQQEPLRQHSHRLEATPLVPYDVWLPPRPHRL